tara:strand:- start:4773 stop:5495 length:723 start_codon:yes stop_codon:yes gene_type:complete
MIRAFGSALLVFGMIAFVSEVKADDNEISLEQSGDNLELGIDQIGYNNIIKMLDNQSYINTTNFSIYLVQNNDSNGVNKIVFDEVSGSNNKIKLIQGGSWEDQYSETNLSWNRDDYEGGGHEIDITLYGNNNEMAGSQTNQGSTTGHDFNFHMAGSDNEVVFKQQSDGQKTLNLTIYNDWNEVFVRQHGSGATHTANITLDGLYGTDFDLKQLGTTTQAYTISVDCMTVGGCSTSVTQGN